MDINVAAWMIAGGPRIENGPIDREREQLHAFREGQRNGREDRVSIVERLLGTTRPKPAEADLVCCTA